jgi:hypothetical protein
MRWFGARLEVREQMAPRRRADLTRRAIQLDGNDLLFYLGQTAEGEAERPNL